MRILVSWLRDFVDVPVEPGELADLLSMRGFELGALEPLADDSGAADAVLDLEITANRPDCLSVLGIAREIATAYDLPLRTVGTRTPPPLDAAALVPDEGREITISLEEPELCPRYAAAVVDVEPTDSPPWMTRRLEAAGVRPINPIVDVTNYVLLELGHPTHAFDLDRLDGAQLRIRRAVPAETVVTLDGIRRELTPDMLVIADATRAQAVAGVMGGADSEVNPRTRRVILESAFFKPTSVRRTSKHLGLKSEASARFERGADVGAPVHALERACALLARIGAGRARGQVVDRYPAPATPRSISLRESRVTQILGLPVQVSEVDRTLRGLGFALTPRDGGGQGGTVWEVEVPTARVDVSREIDLVEEVGRHCGYDRLPSTFPALATPTLPADPRIDRDRRIRRVLTAAGLSEAITFTFIEQAAADRFAGEDGLVPIANPLSETFAVLRPSLIPGLLESGAHNRRRARRDIRLFEIGARFSERYGEVRALGLMWTGAAVAEHWSGGARPVDLFDLKGVLGCLGDALGLTLEFGAASPQSALRVPGRSATVTVTTAHDAGAVGYLGQLAPAIAEGHGLPPRDEVYVAELDLDAIERVAGPGQDVTATPLPRFPSIVRDLSVIVDDALPAGTVRGTIRETAPATLVSVREFDCYRGEGVPDGQVSLSMRLTFRAPERTLKDAEVQQAVEAVVAALERHHGARLRH